MRIVKLSQESRQNLLENLLKRSPGNYGPVSYTPLTLPTNSYV